MASTDSGQFTSRHTNEILCSYSFGRKLWVYAFALSFASIGLLMTLAELVVVAQEVASGIPLDMQRIIGEILPLAGLIVFSLLFPLLFLSMYSDVHISEKGIRVQLLGAPALSTCLCAKTDFSPLDHRLDFGAEAQASIQHQGNPRRIR
jgi:hypothetical protein